MFTLFNKKSTLLNVLVWAGILSAVLFSFSTYLSDFTLLPRFATTSFLLLVATIIFLFSKNETIKFSKTYWLPIALYGIYYLLSAISVFYSINKAESIFDSQRTFIGLLIFIFSTCLFSKNSVIEKHFLYALLIITMVVIGVAVYQIIQLPIINEDSIYLVKSVCGHKNLLSGFLFLLLIFNARLFFIADKKLTKAFSIIGISLCLLLIAFLKTRSAWMAAIVAIAVFTILYILKNRKIFFYKIVVIAFLLVAIFYSVIQFSVGKKIIYKTGVNRFLKIEYSSSSYERLKLWEKTIELIKQKPLLGVGAGNWQINYPSNNLNHIWRAQTLNFTFQRPHNDFLWVMSETGIVGFVLFYGMIFIVSFLFLKNYFSEYDEKIKKSQLVVFAGLMGYLVFSFFDFPKERIEHIFLLNVLLAFTLIGFTNNNFLKDFTIEKRNWVVIFFTTIVMFLLTLNLIIATKRMIGEHYCRAANKCRLENDNNGIIKNCDLSSSFFYNVDPTTMPVKWYRGVANYSLGNYQQALIDFKQAYTVMPFNHHVLNNLGSAYEMEKQHQQAVACFSKAVEINELFDEPRLNLAALYFNAGNYEKAYEWALTVKNEPDRKKYYLDIINQKLNKK